MSEVMFEQTVEQTVNMCSMQAVDLKEERRFCSGMGFYFFVFFLISNGLQLLAGDLLMRFAPEIRQDNFGLYMILATAPMYVIGVPVLALQCEGREAIKLPQRKMSAGKYMIFLMICFGVMIAGNITGIIINQIIGFIKGSPVINSVELLLNNNSLWANIIIVGICAPIFEELVFRKFLVDRMVRYGEATAVVVSGLIFGLFHGNFTQFFYAAALGMLFAFVYVKTGRLRYTILTHFIINMSSTLLVPVLQKIDLEKLETFLTQITVLLEKNISPEMMASMIERKLHGMSDMFVSLIILLIYEMIIYGMSFAGIILLIMRRKHFVCNPGIETIPKGKRASVIWFNVGMILCTIACLAMFVYMIL